MKHRGVIRLSMESLRDRLGFCEKVEILGVKHNSIIGNFEFLLSSDSLPQCRELEDPKIIPIDDISHYNSRSPQYE